MNERIKELAEQCTTINDSTTFPVDKDFDYEKFAKLIIAKCVAQCEFVAGQAEITNTGEIARKTKATADSCAFFIKEYFGVEE